MNSCITQKLQMRARVFSKSTCRHNIGGMVGDLQALCSAVVHYQRQRGRRVRIQGHKGVWGSKCLAAHTLQEAREPPVRCSTRADPAGWMALQTLFQDFTWIYTQRRALEHTEVVCRYLYHQEIPLSILMFFSQQYCYPASEPPSFPHKHNTCPINGGEGEEEGNQRHDLTGIFN